MNNMIIDYMKDALVLFMMIKSRLLRICQQKMDLSPYTQEIYKFSSVKSLKYIRTCR